MSGTRVKTTYSVSGAYGSTETKELYCHHHNGSDTVTFYDKNGEVTAMAFVRWLVCRKAILPNPCYMKCRLI